MTRTGSSKFVSRDRAKERLVKAQSFRQVAHLADTHIDDLLDASPVASNAVLAVIAFTDAITIEFQEQVSQDDHAAAVKLLRKCLGKALPNRQESNLEKLLDLKTEMQYGARRSRTDEARRAIALMDEYAEWAIYILKERGVALES